MLFLSEGDQALAQVPEVVESIPGDTQTLPGYGPGQPAVGGPA